MSKKKKSFRMAPLQRLAVKPIDAPAEQAALDDRLKQSEETIDAAAIESYADSKLTASVVLELCGQLSAKARIDIVSELIAQFSVKERIDLLWSWVSEVDAKLRKKKKGTA